MSIILPDACKKALEQLNKAGYEAYVVGGCVRDSLLGKKPMDWDICTSALPVEIENVFAKRRVIPTGEAHGTMTVLFGKEALEITTFRIDGEYEDHRRPKDVIYTRFLAEDLARRDFTINAMAWHPEIGLVDLYGGKEDLRNRVVRAVGDPETRFNEDGLRIMRLVRFATVLDFEYDKETAKAAKKLNYLLQYISRERLQAELNKILLSVNVARGLGELVDFGIMPYLLPMMCHEVAFEQNSAHQFLDVFEHTSLATGLIEPDLILRLTMLLHDIGKPFTWQIGADGQDEFPDHDVVGAKLANAVLRYLRYDNKTRREVVRLVRHHNDMLIDDRRLLRHNLAELGTDTVYRLISVKVADILAHDIREERESVVSLFADIRATVDDIIASGEPISIADLAIDGQDVQALGYKGKEIGDALALALQTVLDEPVKNTRETLLALLKDASI